MAAITRVDPRPVTPVGYEVNDRGMATEDIAVSDTITISSTGVSKCAAAATECHGIALKAAKSGMLCEYGVMGEMDGFSGLTVGAPLYPSNTTAGVLDTTQVTYVTNVPVPTRVRAVTATRIRYNFT